MKRSVIIFIFAFSIAGCNAETSYEKRDSAKRLAEEKSKRNPVQKSRYDCWQLSAEGDKIAPPLYILSDEIYQVGEVTGKYTFNQETNAIEFRTGPLHQVGSPLIAIYTPLGTPTAGGGKTLETMLEIRRKADMGAGEKKVVMQCNCSEFKY